MKKWVLIAVAGITGGALFFYVQDRKETETQKIIAELDAYKATLPNYTDSIDMFNAKEGKTIKHLSQRFDSLENIKETTGVEPKEFKAVQDSLVARNSRINDWVVGRMETEMKAQAHLDSVKSQAGFFVSRQALKYSK